MAALTLFVGAMRWVEWLVLAAVIALLMAAGAWMHSVFTDREIAELRAAHAADRAAWAEASAKAQRTARKKEAALRAAVDTSREELTNAKRQNADLSAAVARLQPAAADAHRLRNQLAAYAAGRADQDSLTACTARASALAALLAEGADLLRTGAGLVAAAGHAHDDRAAEVEALLSAWPE